MADSRIFRNALPLGSMLQEYRLESVLGAGGFGITYLASDTHLEKHVAIKEYLPVELSVRALDGSVVPVTSECERDYKWGLERFLLEARTLAKFSHPHIVRVNRYFEANTTGYMVMDYEKGQPLNELLRREPLNEAGLKAILMPLLDGLNAVHAAGFLHRDIKPGNIFLRESGTPVLIDFGAARQAIGGATKSLTSVLTPGYAPLEQYSRDGHQGPWSDIYAMGGVLYRALANDNPPDAVSRMKNDTVPAKLAGALGRASAPFLHAVEWALALDEKQRPQSVEEWKRALEGKMVSPTARLEATRAAPTVVAGATRTVPAGRTVSAPTVPQARRAATRPPVERSGASGRRWLGLALALLLVVAVAAVWKQRAARVRAQQETARIEMERAAAERREAERLARERASDRRRAEEAERQLLTPPEPAVAQVPPEPAMRLAPPSPVPDVRERPGRDREARQAPPQDRLPRRQQQVSQEFRGADADGDGYLSPGEVRGRFPFIAREFERVDADGDGRISPQEFFALRKMQAQKLLRK